MAKLNLKPGDVAWITGYTRANDGVPAKVTKVGRLYITTECHGRFTLEGHGDYGRTLYESKAAYDELNAVKRLWTAIRAAGTGYNGYEPPPVSKEVLLEVARLLGVKHDEA